jgi:hypothetical protein
MLGPLHSTSSIFYIQFSWAIQLSAARYSNQVVWGTRVGAFRQGDVRRQCQIVMYYLSGKLVTNTQVLSILSSASIRGPVGAAQRDTGSPVCQYLGILHHAVLVTRASQKCLAII